MGEIDKKKEEVLAATVADEASHPTPAPQSTTGGGGGGGASGSKQSRPKRARTKAEKKDVQETTSRFHCNYCGRDLSLQIRARCAVCPDYDSCLDCFSVGASLSPHEPSHAYRLVEVVHAPIFQVGWSADEEDKLLEGLEMYGVGNWEQVAKSVGTKNAYETEQHFLKVYLRTQTAPLPDPTELLPVEKPPDKNDDCDPKALRVMHKHQQEDAAGWMPKRQDFVYEWDNEAEDILGDMEISEEDSAKDRELKLQVLEIYNTKLDERKRRKDFVVERGLTDFKGYLANEKKRPREEKEVREKLRVFARFLAPTEMDKCVQGILEERNLRAQIDAFKEGRRNGIISLAEFNRSLPHGKSKSRHSIAAGSESGAAGVGGTLSGTGASRRNKRPNGDALVEDSSNNGNAMNDLKTSVMGPEPDVSEQPGAELLSRTELSLCASLKITVHQYMIVKEVMIRESARLGSLRKKEAKAMVRLDQTKVFKIYDYVLACGWIRSGTSIGGNASSAAARSNITATAPNGTRPA